MSAGRGQPPPGQVVTTGYADRPVCCKCSAGFVPREHFIYTGTLGNPVETIERTCPNCGFVWFVLCADAG